MSTATSGTWRVFFLLWHKNIVIWMLVCRPRCTICWKFNQQTFTEQKALRLLSEELGSVFPGQGLLLNSDCSSSDLYRIQIALSALVEQKEFLERGLGVSHKVCAGTLKPKVSKIPLGQQRGGCLEKPQRRRNRKTERQRDDRESSRKRKNFPFFFFFWWRLELMLPWLVGLGTA